MSIAVLITQCLQRDFVDLVPEGAPVPNKLHVGPEEARRLLGDDPATGPVAQLAAWARKQDALHVIHIRDWHDEGDRKHLDWFGRHCLKDSPGAELVAGLADGKAAIVNAVDLNDVEETDLRDRLARIAKLGTLRIGVVGVWTDAKVSFLLYDLKTRLGIDELATCSALTASSSRTQHFNALSQLRTLLDVKVLDSIADFTAWLHPDATPVHVPSAFGPAFNGEISDAGLSGEDRDVVGCLFRESRRVTLHPLSGGFSGSRVFRATSEDATGHAQAPSVVKLGPRTAIAKERANFERVEEILGNAAPAVRATIEIGERGGLRFAFASMGRGRVRTLKSLFAEDAPDDALIEYVLRDAFDRILEPFWKGAKLERCNLLARYGFAGKWAASVRTKVERVSGKTQSPLCAFYESLPEEGVPGEDEFHWVSYVHGDLNGANLLLDERKNVWMIDWFHTEPAHVLKDLAKIENDLLYIWTPVRNQAELAEALAITRALREVRDLADELPADSPAAAPQFVRAWRVLRLLRGYAKELVRDDRDPRQMSIALLRYAAHTLGFDESNEWQKKWALAAAEGHAEDVSRVTTGRSARRSP